MKQQANITKFKSKSTIKKVYILSKSKEISATTFFVNYTTHYEQAYIWQNIWQNLHLYYKTLLIFRLLKKFLLLCGQNQNKFYLSANHNKVKLLSCSLGMFVAYKTKKLSLQYKKHLKHNKKIKALAIFIRNYIKVSYVKLNFYMSYLPKNLIATNVFYIFRKYKDERFFWESLQVTNAVFCGRASASILANLVVAHTRRNPKRLAFVIYLKRLLNWHYNSLNVLNIVGVRLEVKGRFNAKSRSKKHILSNGRVNMHKKASLVDYAFVNSFTKFGTLGIKVWICSKN